MAGESRNQDNLVVLDADFYNSISADYEKAFGHDIGLLNFINKALSYFPPSSKVLDVGCGTGTPVAKMVAAQGHKVTGIDISPSMVELSRKAVPGGTFEVADMLEYTPAEKMDVVLSILSLFPLSRKEMEAMSPKWADWLLPGGILCICTMDPEEFNPDATMYDEDRMCVNRIPFLFMGDRNEMTLMTRAGWKNMLELAGFELVDTEMNYFEPPAEAKSDPEPHYFIIARKAR